MSWLRIILLIITIPLFLVIWWWSARSQRRVAEEPERREPDFGSGQWSDDHGLEPSSGHLERGGYTADSMVNQHLIDTGEHDLTLTPAERRYQTEPELFDEPAIARHHSSDAPQVTAHAGAALPEIPMVEVSRESAAQYENLDGPIDVVKATVEEVPAWLAPSTDSPGLMPHIPSVATSVPLEMVREPEPVIESVPPREPIKPTAVPSRVVAIRVAFQNRSVSGMRLKMCFDQEGLKFGQHQFYHRLVDGQSQFMVANLNKPGEFDPKTLEARQYNGLTFFAIFSSIHNASGQPVSAKARFDDLFETARRVAEQFGGVLKTDDGSEFDVSLMLKTRDELAIYEPGVSGA